MKFTKLDLLTLLIGLFLFASCKNPDSVGLDVDPNTQITGTLVDTVKITSQTVRESAVTTTALSRHPLGYMIDPIFGKTESSIAMTVVPPFTSYDFGTSPQLDSAVLVLNLGTQFYGDTTTSKYSIDVYQLTNTITNYKSSDVQAHNAALLGNFNSKIFPNTPIKVYDIIAGAKDTLKTVPAQIRIPLNKAFFQSTVLSLPTTGTATFAKFTEYFKGLYAEINKSSSNITATNGGGIAFIDFAGTNSYLQLVYKKTNAAATGVDTVSINFPINTSSGPITANIKHDYTGTPVQTQLDVPNPSVPYNVTYLQALVGLKTKISFPYLKNFSDKHGKVVVNKAELVVDLSAGTYGYPFLPAQRLSLYRWDIAQQPVYLPDNDVPTQYNKGDVRANLTAPYFGGYYDSLKNRYVFSVTSYIQDLIDNKKTDYGTFIAPTSLTEFQITPSASSAARSVIGTYGSSGKRLKLNIYYTKIN